MDVSTSTHVPRVEVAIASTPSLQGVIRPCTLYMHRMEVIVDTVLSPVEASLSSDTSLSKATSSSLQSVSKIAAQHNIWLVQYMVARK